MGCSSSNTFTTFKVAIKLPKGKECKKYSQNKFIEGGDINNWIKNLFIGKNWKYWIIYNDKIEKLGLIQKTKSQSKGILVWNSKKIGFLQHSVSNFPQYFNTSDISEINEEELIKSQHFCYIEFDNSEYNMRKIIEQIVNISPNIYIFNSNITIPEKVKNKDLFEFYLGENIYLISKSPHNEIDTYDTLVQSHGVKLKLQNEILINSMRENENIKFASLFKEKGENTYKLSENNCKIGISVKCDRHLNIFSDLGRVKKDIDLGGLTICITDEGLWIALNIEII
jgi:hypothetical protein